MLGQKKTPLIVLIGFIALLLAGCANMQKPIVLDSDVSFGFGSAELTPAGQQKIDMYSSSLLARGETRIEIVGHSDRIGDAKANQVLSERRAQAVRDQLLKSRLPPEQMIARGAGAADPVVYCDQQNHQALIACLAPNRRVEIRVTDIRW